MSVIVYSTAPLVIGRRYTHEIIDHNGDAFNQPFIPLREATREEWLQHTEDGEKKEQWLIARGESIAGYYEISTD